MLEESGMTAFCSHQDRLHEPAAVGRSPIVSWLGVLLRRAISHAFGSRDDWSFEPAVYRSHDCDAAKFPQRPLILGDKWDF
jgi:hypothetical protein